MNILFILEFMAKNKYREEKVQGQIFRFSFESRPKWYRKTKNLSAKHLNYQVDSQT